MGTQRTQCANGGAAGARDEAFAQAEPGAPPARASHQPGLMAAPRSVAGESAAKRRRAATSRAPGTRTASASPGSATQTPESTPDAPAPARTAPGATKAAILAALADGGAMTAREIAAASGLGRATVSTTLSRLAASGELAKAARGYQIKT